MFELATYRLFSCLCIINSFDNFLVVIVIQHYPRCSGDKDKWPHIATKESSTVWHQERKQGEIAQDVSNRTYD